MIKNIQVIISFALLGLALYGGLTLIRNIQGNNALRPTALAVIKDVQSLARLETATYTVEKIVDIDNAQTKNALQNFLFGDKLLLVATGQVVAGIDMGKLDAKAVHINAGAITITLPAPEVFTAGLDETKTRVYDRKTGLLASPNKDMETEARTHAIEQIRTAACEGGVLDTANESAKVQIENLLKSLGFISYTIQTQTGACK